MFTKIYSHLQEAKAKGDGYLKSGDKAKKKVNQACSKIGQERWAHPKDAFDEIQKVCKENGLVIVDEENSEWSGMWSAGKEDKEHETTFMLAKLDSQEDKGHGYKPFNTTIENSMLVFTWYKGTGQKRWEVNCYLS